MSYTKRQFVESAFAEIGLASYVWDLTPEQMQEACRRLDVMMAGWYARGIKVGYPISVTPDNSSLDSETNVPSVATEAIITNLAIRLGPQYGKQIPPETKSTAKNAYDSLLLFMASPIELQFPSTLPIGAGNKRVLLPAPFAAKPDLGPITNTDNGQLNFLS